MKITIVIEHEGAENCLVHETDSFEKAILALNGFAGIRPIKELIEERILLAERKKFEAHTEELTYFWDGELRCAQALLNQVDQALPGSEQTVIATFEDGKLVKEVRRETKRETDQRQ